MWRPVFPTSRSPRPRSCTSARRCSYSINSPVLDCATKDQHPQTYRGALGATDYYLKKFGKNALHGVFLYPSDLKSAKNSQVPAFTAQQQAGIKQDATFDVSARATQPDYTPFVQAMKDNGSTYARHGGNDAGCDHDDEGSQAPEPHRREGVGLLVAVLRQGHPRRTRDRGPVRLDLVLAVRRDEVEQDARQLREVHGWPREGRRLRHPGLGCRRLAPRHRQQGRRRPWATTRSRVRRCSRRHRT